MQIDSQQLSKKLASQDKPVVLDVRTAQETQAEGFIAGALRIPLDQLQARLHEVPHDVEVVAVCKRGMRSMNAAGLLRQSGRNALSLAGGMDAWLLAGLPVSRE